MLHDQKNIQIGLREEELNKLAKQWIELLISGILEDCKSSFPVVFSEKSTDNKFKSRL